MHLSSTDGPGVNDGLGVNVGDLVVVGALVVVGDGVGDAVVGNFDVVGAGELDGANVDVGRLLGGREVDGQMYSRS